MISETTHSGAKKKTYVHAAGAKIATQSEYSYFSQTTESVSFEHFDAAGMSHRSTASDGTALTADGAYDGAPAEMDPMGGNVGIATPYIQEVIQPPPPNENFPYFPLDGDSPMYVNGQQVSCTLDGLSIGCGTAFSMLGHSADIDFANTSSWILSQVGIFAVPRAVGNNEAPTPPGGDPNTAYATTRYQYEYFFNNISWGPQISSPDEKPEDAVKNAITEGSNLVAKDKCKSAIEELLRKAFMEKLKADGVDYNKLSAEEKAEIDKFRDSELTASKLIDSVKNATHVYAPNDLRLTGKDGHHGAETTHSGGKVTVSFFGGFFNEIMSGKSDISVQVGPALPPRPYKGNVTSLTQRASTVIHEGIHAIYPGFSDGFIGRIIKNKTKDLSREEGSKAINDFIKDKCN